MASANKGARAAAGAKSDVPAAAAMNGKTSGPKKIAFDATYSRQFASWMAEQKVSLAFTTYQANLLFLVGTRPDGRLSFFRRSIPRCMGMHVRDQSLYISSLYQIWRFENALLPGQQHNGCDRVYVPKVSHVTGDVDVHDMAVNNDGKLIFICTLFSCLATTSETHSLKPLWKPPFVSKLAAEDRCHMNGLAMRNGRPAWVTTVSEGDVTDGWRDHRRSGGTVIDIATNEIIVRGLSMPHSPRWYRDRLWLHNSGTGYFGYIDLKAGKFEPVCFCPGYLRGLDFVGDFAVVGLSQARHDRVFTGLPLQDNLEAKKGVPRCGLMVIDLRSGDIVHWARFEGVVQELYDVSVLPHCTRPMAIGFQNDEIRRAINLEQPDGNALQWLAAEEAAKPKPGAVAAE